LRNTVVIFRQTNIFKAHKNQCLWSSLPNINLYNNKLNIIASVSC